MREANRRIGGGRVKSFIGDWWERQRPTLQVAGQLRAIGELHGRAALYENQTPQVLETLRQVAMIQSTESSNRIEGITIPSERLAALMRDKTHPRDRSEAEVAGYRDVLRIIHASAADIPVKPSVILQLHRDLYARTDLPGGRWKPTDNRIVERRPDGTEVVRFLPTPAFETPGAMDTLCNGYNGLVGRMEPLLLIPTFVLDFLCVHPFSDGNGRMARLLTLLLLYQHGYTVGRYISLERVIEDSKEGYYESLHASSQEWHEGQHDPMPWWSYWLGVILLAYREFEERAGMITGRRGAKTEMIIQAIRDMQGDFSIADLRRHCPDTSVDMIRRVLRQLRDQGLVQPLDRGGPNARWRKLGTFSEN